MKDRTNPTTKSQSPENIQVHDDATWCKCTICGREEKFRDGDPQDVSFMETMYKRGWRKTMLNDGKPGINGLFATFTWCKQCARALDASNKEGMVY